MRSAPTVVLAFLGFVSAMPPQQEAEFNQWMNQHGKSYQTKDEYDFRMNIFARNIN